MFETGKMRQMHLFSSFLKYKAVFFRNCFYWQVPRQSTPPRPSKLCKHLHGLVRKTVYYFLPVNISGMNRKRKRIPISSSTCLRSRSLAQRNHYYRIFNEFQIKSRKLCSTKVFKMNYSGAYTNTSFHSTTSDPF